MGIILLECCGMNSLNIQTLQWLKKGPLNFYFSLMLKGIIWKSNVNSEQGGWLIVMKLKTQNYLNGI
jgi:hypothetical protein